MSSECYDPDLLYKVVLTLNSVDKTLVYEKSNKSY